MYMCVCMCIYIYTHVFLWLYVHVFKRISAGPLGLVPRNLFFVGSWNHWAEQHTLEPDDTYVFGHGALLGESGHVYYTYIYIHITIILHVCIYISNIEFAYVCMMYVDTNVNSCMYIHLYKYVIIITSMLRLAKSC